MPSERFLLDNPHAWALLSALFLGAALARLARGAPRSADPERARNARWVLVCLLLSLCLAAALGALAVDPRGELRQRGTLWFFLGGAAAAFLALRFRRGAGAPVLLLCVALPSTASLLLGTLRPLAGETEVARVRVLAAGEDGMVLDIAPAGLPAAVVRLEGRWLAPSLRVVIFDGRFVFLRARSWYRLEGLQAYGSRQEAEGLSPPREGAAHRLPAAGGVPGRLYAWLLERAGALPAFGIRVLEPRAAPLRPRELEAFSIVVDEDGTAAVRMEEGPVAREAAAPPRG